MTALERASSLRSADRGLDVRDAARDVIKRMSIFDRIRNKSSHEEGLEFIDSNNRCFARFDVDKSGKGESITCDVEILRGELAGILFNVTKDDVFYIFDDMVESLKEADKEVDVSFVNGTSTTAFDLVVADSKIRDIAFGNGYSHVRALDSYVSYFSISPSDTNTMWSRAH